MSRRERQLAKRPLSGASLSGFTLIELLVVISIVALLMAILMPTLQAVRKQGQAVKCRGTLRQWGLFYSMYTAENDYKMPLVGPVKFLGLPWVLPVEFYRDRGGGKGRGPIEAKEGGYSHLGAYRKLLLCPSATRFPPYTFPYAGSGVHSPWNLAPDREVASSYGQNGWMPVMEYPDEGDKRVWVSCLVKGAAAVPVYSDCKKPFGVPHPMNDPPADKDGEATYDFAWGITVYVMDRHNGGINSLFMDWSVRKVGLKELWTLKWGPNFNTAGPWTKAGGVQPDDWPLWMRKFKDY